MKSRQRVLTALNHKEPDQVPIDLAATTVTSITYPSYRTLRQYLGLEPDDPPVLSHLHQGTVHPTEDLYQHYAVDFRTVYLAKSPRGHAVKTLPDGSFYDEYDILWSKMEYDYSPGQAPWLVAQPRT
jgi:uroporphyrinogen decarboxylase